MNNDNLIQEFLYLYHLAKNKKIQSRKIQPRINPKINLISNFNLIILLCKEIIAISDEFIISKDFHLNII